jgi:hypothetical protein
LTGSAIAWGREFDGQTTTFGVSGLIFKTNLMPFDRLTESLWSQMRLDCVNGKLIGSKAETYQVVETRWDTWLKMCPGTTVASTNTGFNRNYLQFPYVQGGQDYRTSNSFFLFPFSPMDNRLSSKNRVLGVIIDNRAKVYPIQSLNDDVTVIEDEFEGVDLVVVGSRSENFIAAYENETEDGTRLTFSSIQGDLPVVMSDNEGNRWNIFGEAVAGPRVGQRLGPTQSLIGYWFTFGSFYPDARDIRSVILGRLFVLGTIDQLWIQPDSYQFVLAQLTHEASRIFN